MKCPKCYAYARIVSTEKMTDSVERLKECKNCGYRFYTVEIDKDLYEKVVLRNGCTKVFGAGKKAR